jgi:hypothetical protein
MNNNQNNSKAGGQKPPSMRAKKTKNPVSQSNPVPMPMSKRKAPNVSNAGKTSFSAPSRKV